MQRMVDKLLPVPRSGKTELSGPEPPHGGTCGLTHVPTGPFLERGHGQRGSGGFVPADACSGARGAAQLLAFLASSLSKAFPSARGDLAGPR